MLFRVSGSGFRQLIYNVAGTGAKKSVNLTFSKGTLRVQSQGIVLVEDFMDIQEQDTDSESFSTTLNDVVALITDEALNILINGDTMMLMQNGFNYSVLREYTEPVEVMYNTQVCGALSKNQLDLLCRDISAIELVTRGLGKETFEVFIQDGRCYIDGQCLAYECPLQLVNTSLTNKTLKELARFAKSNWKYAVGDGMLSFCEGRKRVVVVMKETDKQHVQALATQEGLKLLAKGVSIRAYKETFDALYKVYSRSLVNVTIGKNGFSFFVDNGEARVNIGSVAEKVCGIQLSMQQAACMIKIMSQYGSLAIYGGGDRICLIPENANKKLTLAGIVY